VFVHWPFYFDNFNQSDDHLENDLLEFAYKHTRYEFKNKIKSVYILNYVWEPIINIWQFGKFSHEKSFV
jgi:hypothetical protein